MSTPTSQLLSPSSASPDQFAVQFASHQQPSVEPGLAGFSELHASSSDSHSVLNTSLSSLKTEYKSKFTPFDQYVYNEITDSFVRPPSASPVAPSLTDHLLLTPGGCHGSPDVHHQQDHPCSRASSTEQPAAPAASEPWYKEVQRRNEKANEYRYKSEVGHSSATQTPHCREDYKRDHLISHLANNNNFNLPKDTSSSNSRTAHGSHVASSRPATRTPAQVRSKSQSTVRRTHHAPSATTTSSSNASKNLNLTPTRAPDRHPIARPSPNITSSTARAQKSNPNPLDTRAKPLNSSAISRTGTRIAGNQHQENYTRPTSTAGSSSLTNKQRPATGTLRVTAAPRQTSRQPAGSSTVTTTAQRNNVSSASSRTTTTAQRLSHAKTVTSGNRTSTSSAPAPAIKSIKTPQAIGAAAVAATAATITAAVLSTPDETPLSQPTNATIENPIVKKEIEEEIVKQTSNHEELTAFSPQEPDLEVATAINLEPRDNNWISSHSSSEIAEPPTNFMFSNTETGNMLADELAEAELQRQKAIAFNALSDDQSYQTNETEAQQKSTEEFPQVSKDDEENQMYSIMPVVGGGVSISKDLALEPMSESLEVDEINHHSTEAEPREMRPVVIEADGNKSIDEIANEEPSEAPNATHQSQKEVEIDDDDEDVDVPKDVVGATNQSTDKVHSNQQDAIEIDQETKQILDTVTVVSEQEELSKRTPEVDEGIQENATEPTRQESGLSVQDKMNLEQQSRTEDDLNKLLDGDVTDTKVALSQEEGEGEQGPKLLVENATQQPLLPLMSEGRHMLDQTNYDLASDEPSDHSNESHTKEALAEEDSLVKDDFHGKKIEEPVVDHQIKSELLMDVNSLLDDEARKKLEMSRKSELARKSSSPLTDIGEVLLSPIQLDLASQKELKQDNFDHEHPTLYAATDQRDIFSQDRIEKAEFRLESEPKEGSQADPTGEVNLVTTPKNSVETLTLDDNTFLGDTSNEWKQQKQETDERERSVGDELPEENISALRDTEKSAIVDVNILTPSKSSELDQTASVDETWYTVDSSRVTDRLSEPVEDVGANSDFETVEQDSEDKEEAKDEIKIESSENMLNFTGHDLSPNMTQGGNGSTWMEEDFEVKDDIISSSAKLETMPTDSNVVPQHSSEEDSTNHRILDYTHDHDLISNGMKLETDLNEAGKADQSSVKLDENINKFTMESKSSSAFEDHFNPADSGEPDLMKQMNMDSGYVNNKNSDDEAALEPSKTRLKEKLDLEPGPAQGLVANIAPLADINSDADTNQEEKEAHGELYRQLNISPKERKVSLDMDKNTLRRKLSSRSSSSTSSSHASSSASSSLERVVHDDIKSDYEELAARMTSDLIASGGGDGAASLTGDLLATSSGDISQSSAVAKVIGSAAPQQLADGATATNLLD